MPGGNDVLPGGAAHVLVHDEPSTCQPHVNFIDYMSPKDGC